MVPPVAFSPRWTINAVGLERSPGSPAHAASVAMPLLLIEGRRHGMNFTSPCFGGLNHWPDISKQDHRRMTPAFWMLGIAGVVGLFAAGKSIARKEEPWYLAVLGLILNVPPVLLWLLRVADKLIEWAGVM